jgi:hypothetical protein
MLKLLYERYELVKLSVLNTIAPCVGIHTIMPRNLSKRKLEPLKQQRENMTSITGVEMSLDETWIFFLFGVSEWIYDSADQRLEASPLAKI